MKAIGIIETVGMVPAISALDTCLKSANVEIQSFNYVSSGIVTFTIKGDVGSVNAAISAGVAECENFGSLRSSHIIPRPIDNIDIALQGGIIDSSLKYESSNLKNNKSSISLSSEKDFENIDIKGSKTVDVINSEKIKIFGNVNKVDKSEKHTIKQDNKSEAKSNIYAKTEENVKAPVVLDKAREKAKKLVEDAKKKAKERILLEKNLKESLESNINDNVDYSKASLQKKTIAELRDILVTKGSKEDFKNMKKDKLIETIIKFSEN